MRGSTDALSKAYEQSRYSVPHHILRSEAIYGEGFQSPGGVEGFKETLFHRMPIAPGMRLLDIGSGLGGAAFFVATRTGAHVTGLDLSEIMVSIANQRREQHGHMDRVEFVHGDIHCPVLRGRTFDLVYSKDSLMYEADKPGLFSRCFELIEPGGHICISDFCVGETSSEFDRYMHVSGYDLRSIEAYAGMLADAGFDVLTSEDTSHLALKFLEVDLERYSAAVRSGAQAVAEEDANHIIERWQRKIRFSKNRQLVQGLFIAKRP